MPKNHAAPDDKISKALDQLAIDVVDQFLTQLTPLLREKALRIANEAWAEELDLMAGERRTLLNVGAPKTDTRSVKEIAIEVLRDQLDGRANSMRALRDAIEEKAPNLGQSYILRALKEMIAAGHIREIGSTGVITCNPARGNL